MLQQQQQNRVAVSQHMQPMYQQQPQQQRLMQPAQQKIRGAVPTGQRVNMQQQQPNQQPMQAMQQSQQQQYVVMSQVIA